MLSLSAQHAENTDGSAVGVLFVAGIVSICLLALLAVFAARRI